MSSNDVIYLSEVRLSFPNLVAPQVQKNEGGTERISYNCDLISPPDHPGYAMFMKSYSERAAEEWKQNAQQIMQMVHADRKSRCYGSGAEKIDKKTFQPYIGYAGNVYISCSSKNPPQMILPNGSPANPSDTMAYKALAMKLYGGCYVNAAIRPWFQKPNPQKNYSYGIRCDIVAVQFCKDGEPFGEGRPDVTGMFGQVAGAPAAPGVPGFAAPPMPGVPFPGAVATPVGVPAPQFAAPVPPMPAAPFGTPTLPNFLGQK